jgi:hypothetical protein
MDYTELARATVEFVKPYLAAAGTGLVQDGLGEARRRIIGWLKSKFTKPAQTGALAEAEASPEDAGAIEALQLQLRRLLEQQEALRQELLELLPKELHPPGTTQTSNQSGDHNVGVQNTGSGNNIHIQR